MSTSQYGEDYEDHKLSNQTYITMHPPETKDTCNRIEICYDTLEGQNWSAHLSAEETMELALYLRQWLNDIELADIADQARAEIEPDHLDKEEN